MPSGVDPLGAELLPGEPDELVNETSGPMSALTRHDPNTDRVPFGGWSPLMDWLLKEEASIQGAGARPVACECDDVEPFG